MMTDTSDVADVSYMRGALIEWNLYRMSITHSRGTVLQLSCEQTVSVDRFPLASTLNVTILI